METGAQAAELSYRGIAPNLLLNQVQVSVPFALQTDFLSSPPRKPERFLARLQQGAVKSPTHFDYFELCLCAHFATVASFVPTDVDSQIRFKLWDPRRPAAELSRMSEIVKEALDWDTTRVSARWVRSPKTGEILSGHGGEWFSVAIAAYGAFRRRDPDLAAEIAGWILRELDREGGVYQDLKSARDGIGLLKAATLMAHNLGDLDRVTEIWNLPEDDPLKRATFKLGHEGPGRFNGLFLEAGRLNKSMTADENHRHFALRAPRALRKSADFLLPVGPFFDEWGSRLARHPLLNPEDLAVITEALADGWLRLQSKGQPVGYARALAGILEGFSGGFSELARYLPARVVRNLKSGELHALISTPRKRFEEQWNQMALKRLS